MPVMKKFRLTEKADTCETGNQFTVFALKNRKDSLVFALVLIAFRPVFGG